MDREAQRAIVHGLSESDMTELLSMSRARAHTHTHSYNCQGPVIAVPCQL